MLEGDWLLCALKFIMEVRKNKSPFFCEIPEKEVLNHTIEYRIYSKGFWIDRNSKKTVF